MQLTVVIPTIVPERRQRCLGAWSHQLPAEMGSALDGYHLVNVDNAPGPTGDGVNLGVAASWNRGVRVALERGSDWLLVVSEAVVPAHRGLRFLVDALRDPESPDVVGGLELGWKCAAIRLAVLMVVGTFDENFWPGYYEDTDYLYRMGLAGFDSPRENGRGHRHEPVLLMEPVEDAHALRETGIRPDFDWLRRYYVRKWGGDQGSETFDHPFGAPEHGVDWWEIEADAPVNRREEHR